MDNGRLCMNCANAGVDMDRCISCLTETGMIHFKPKSSIALNQGVITSSDSTQFTITPITDSVTITMSPEELETLKRQSNLGAALESAQSVNSVITELIRLVSHHPDAKILPIVRDGVTSDDRYGQWVGSWGAAELDYAYFDEPDETTYLKGEDEEILVDRYMDEIKRMGPEMSLEMIEKLAEDRFKALPWVKVIVVRIEPFQGMETI